MVMSIWILPNNGSLGNIGIFPYAEDLMLNSLFR